MKIKGFYSRLGSRFVGVEDDDGLVFGFPEMDGETLLERLEQMKEVFGGSLLRLGFTPQREDEIKENVWEGENVNNG